MADFLADDDLKGYSKVRNRIPKARPKEDVEAVRRELWFNRIKKFLNKEVVAKETIASLH